MDIGCYSQRSPLGACALSYFMSDDTIRFINPNNEGNSHGVDNCNNNILLNTDNNWNTGSEQRVGSS